MSILKKYTDWRQWLHALAKDAVHNGTGAVLAGFGTNGVEMLAPNMLEGMGMNAKQAFAMFVVAALLSALRFINAATADTNQPVEKP